MHRLLLLLLLNVLSLTFSNAATPAPHTVSSFNRSSFPPGFLFGSGSSAYQTEGSPLKYGRGPCSWDVYTKKYPERIVDHSNGEVATDFYHRYKEDIQLAKRIGLDTYRMSLSWSRIIPSGMIKGGVNSVAVKFYNDVINEMVANGIKPFVTLYHDDTPQALDIAYGGPLSSDIVNDFRDFADFCFGEFGDRVKYWTTINEPDIFSRLGYASTALAPGRCSSYDGNCSAGNSATEPYIVAHNLLLSHAAAGNLYKHKYQAKQNGKIGMNFAASWFYPLNDTAADRGAVLRALDFGFLRILHPLIFGEYPASMRQILGSRLPTFTKEQSEMLIRSQDFITINYYSSSFVFDVPSPINNVNLSIATDGRYGTTGFRNGLAIGGQTAVGFFFDHPRGLYNVLAYIKKHYGNPIVYITENGTISLNPKTTPLFSANPLGWRHPGMATEGSLTIKEAINDTRRITFMNGQLKFILKAIRRGSKVKGYSSWSFTDNWEWSSGFTVRFGLIHIDTASLMRYVKASALWYKKFLLR